MDTAEFDKMFEVEETNWWYRGRRHLVSGWVEEHARRLGRPLRILDVASATGMSHRFLGHLGTIWSLDISDETIRLCKQRGIHRIVQGDAEKLPFRDESFDLILALDALEHFRDDLSAMNEIRRIARPDALVLITVPAFMTLWSPHDDAYHHMRRYTRGELGGKLRDQGLAVRKLSYYSMSFLAPVFAMRKMRKAATKDGEARSDFFIKFPGFLESLLFGIMRFEIALMKVFNLPFGVSLFCAAGRPPAKPPAC